MRKGKERDERLCMRRCVFICFPSIYICECLHGCVCVCVIGSSAARLQISSISLSPAQGLLGKRQTAPRLRQRRLHPNFSPLQKAGERCAPPSLATQYRNPLTPQSGNKAQRRARGPPQPERPISSHHPGNSSRSKEAAVRKGIFSGIASNQKVVLLTHTCAIAEIHFFTMKSS